jgi:hypothetical protein
MKFYRGLGRRKRARYERTRIEGGLEDHFAPQPMDQPGKATPALHKTV